MVHLRKRLCQLACVCAFLALARCCLWPYASAGHSALNRLLLDLLIDQLPAAVVGDWSQISGLVVAGGSPVRVAEALDLAREHPHLMIVLTGPGDAELEKAIGARDVARHRVLLELSASNTYENGVLSKELALPDPHERWLLVTSAHHMPRAVASFHRAGFPVEPWPVYDRPTHDLEIARVVRHGWLGLLGPHRDLVS